MKINEGKSLYSNQIINYQKRKTEIEEQLAILKNKENIDESGSEYYNEAATLELSHKDITAKQDEAQLFLDNLSKLEAGISEIDYLSKKAEATKEAGKENAKILEVARRIARGDKVPAEDERKLMEFNAKLYMAVKQVALLAKSDKEHSSLWEDEEKADVENISEIPGDAEITIDMPELVPIDEIDDISE